MIPNLQKKCVPFFHSLLSVHTYKQTNNSSYRSHIFFDSFVFPLTWFGRIAHIFRFLFLSYLYLPFIFIFFCSFSISFERINLWFFFHIFLLDPMMFVYFLLLNSIIFVCGVCYSFYYRLRPNIFCVNMPNIYLCYLLLVIYFLVATRLHNFCFYIVLSLFDFLF